MGGIGAVCRDGGVGMDDARERAKMEIIIQIGAEHGNRSTAAKP